MTSLYQTVRCYRVRASDYQTELAIIRAADRREFSVEYRRDVVDIWLPDSAESTLFLLRWGDSLLHLSYLDFHRSWQEADQ